MGLADETPEHQDRDARRGQPGGEHLEQERARVGPGSGPGPTPSSDSSASPCDFFSLIASPSMT
ncbi:hypothetical protein [Nocardiopsis lucentensis]|uniref:hypothetical protein n=1 Tax=Nocardiopsis lucentensis TaxID=53441 RepID=UPI001267C164|nr:hypothetical protein [Nocardiopsis lucentensis]